MKTILSVVQLLIIFCSCVKPCGESRGIEGAGLNITFINTANNEYFYPELPILYSSIFKLDSLQVKDSNGKTLTTPSKINSDPINPLKKFYVVEIYPIFIPSDDQASYANEQTKKIYIKYNYNTFDTITIVYKTKKEKCINNYEYIKSYYKNSLLAENFGRPDVLQITLKH